MKKRYWLNQENANQIEFTRCAFFNAGIDRKYVPSAHRVYQAKSDARAQYRRENIDEAEFQEPLRDFVSGYTAPTNPGTVDADCSLFISQDFVCITEVVTAIPFTCLWLLAFAKSFLEQGRKLRLVFDFTHKILHQNFKLGVLAIAGLHFSRGDWVNTVFPVFYCLSRKENAAAYLPLLQAFKYEMQTRFQINIEDVIATVFTDGHEACKIALRVQLLLAFQPFAFSLCVRNH